MGLRNAFEEIVTEGTLRQLLDHLRFAKDNADRVRVVVDNTVPVSGTVTSTVNAGNTAAAIGATVVAPFSQNSWNNVDAREELMILSQNNFQTTRNRWSIT